jgi:hypothetical protein
MIGKEIKRDKEKSGVFRGKSALQRGRRVSVAPMLDWKYLKNNTMKSSA